MQRSLITTNVVGSFENYSKNKRLAEIMNRFKNKEWRVSTEDYDFTFSYDDIDGAFSYPVGNFFVFRLVGCKGIKQKHGGAYPLNINLGEIDVYYDDEEVLITKRPNNGVPVLEHEL